MRRLLLGAGIACVVLLMGSFAWAEHQSCSSGVDEGPVHVGIGLHDLSGHQATACAGSPLDDPEGYGISETVGWDVVGTGVYATATSCDHSGEASNCADYFGGPQGASAGNVAIGGGVTTEGTSVRLLGSDYTMGKTGVTLGSLSMPCFGGMCAGYTVAFSSTTVWINGSSTSAEAGETGAYLSGSFPTLPTVVTAPPGVMYCGGEVVGKVNGQEVSRMPVHAELGGASC